MYGLDSSLLDVAKPLKRIFDVLLSILENRIELLSLEVREQQYYFIRLFLFMCGFLFFGALAVLLIIGTIIYALDSETRLVGLIIATGVLVLIAFCAFIKVLILINKYPRPFSQTLSELKKDRNSL